MADFKGHLVGASLVSGIAATALAMGSALPESTILGSFSLGLVGGLLPDSDSDNSIPIRIGFNVLSVIAAFLLVFSFTDQLSLIELLLLGLAGFALIRFGVFSIFAEVTVHRGLIHSIPAAAIAGLLTTFLAHSIFAVQIIPAWLAGTFVAGGFLVHLILDEIYSVDLLGRKIKRSFGTAFNLGSLNNLLGTAGLYLAIAGLYHVCPDWRPFWQMASDPGTYLTLESRIWPHGVWFAGLLDLLVS